MQECRGFRLLNQPGNNKPCTPREMAFDKGIRQTKPGISAHASGTSLRALPALDLPACPQTASYQYHDRFYREGTGLRLQNFQQRQARISSNAVAIIITVRRPILSLRSPDGIMVSAKPISSKSRLSTVPVKSGVQCRLQIGWHNHQIGYIPPPTRPSPGQFPSRSL